MSGATVTPGVLPGSTDDVFFDAVNAPSFNTAGAKGPTFTGSSACRNLSINFPATLSTQFNFSINTRMDIWGNVTINIPGLFNVASGLYFQLAANGNTNTINLGAGTNAFGNTIFDNSFGGTFNVLGVYTNGNTTTFATNNVGPIVTVNFTTGKAALGNVTYNAKAVVNYNLGFKKPSINNFNTFILAGAVVTTLANSDFASLTVSGTLNANNITLTGAGVQGGNALPTATLNIVNSTVILQNSEAAAGSTQGGVWNYGTSVTANLGFLNATNSQLIFPNGAGVWTPSNGLLNIYGFEPFTNTFNVVKITDIPSEKFAVQSTIYQYGNQIPTIDSLIIDAEMYHVNNSTLNISSLFQVKPGHTYEAGITTNATWAINMAPTATTSIVGTCDSAIVFNYLCFSFQAGSLTYLNADYLVLKNSRVLSGGPANAGANSVKTAGSTTTGWTLSGTGLPTSRTLYYIGTATDSLSATTLGKWWDKNNWSTNATASPSNPIGGPQCPPTFMDSVVFPAGSYVYCNRDKQYTKSMLWQGAGTIYGANYQELEIWGSLELSVSMLNHFYGTVWFKTYETYPTITTRGQAFGAGVLFDGTNLTTGAAAIQTFSASTGIWTLRDKLYVPNYDKVDNNYPYAGTNSFNVMNSNAYNNIALLNGHLKTGVDANLVAPCVQIDPVLSQSQDIDCRGITLRQGQISLFNSNVLVRDTGFSWYQTGNFYVASPNNVLKINAGTSTINLKGNFANPTNYSSFPQACLVYAPVAMLGNGFKYYNILFSGTNGTGILEMFNDTIHNVTFKGGGIIRDFSPNFVTANGVTPKPAGIIQRADFTNPTLMAHIDAYYQPVTGVANPATDADTSYNNKITIDSLYFAGNGNFDNINTKIRSVLSFTPGYTYNIKNGQSVELAAPSSGANYPYPYTNTCATGSAYNFATGGTLIANGNCVGSVKITNGKFLGNSVIGNVTNCVIDNNIFTGTGYNYTNSIVTGTTTGWAGIPLAGRKLRWKDVSAVAGNTQQWGASSSWEEIFPNGTVKFAAPQCPPTRIDTVVFDVTSFSANGQKVQVNLSGGTAECYSMYWGTQAPNVNVGSQSKAPVFDAAVAQNLSVFGNLQFNNGMVQNYLGPITFRGPYDLNNSNFNTIESAGKSFNELIYFNADADTKRWNLKDQLTSVSSGTLAASQDVGGVNLWRGILDTKGNAMDLGNFFSVSSTKRSLYLNNSTITLRKQSKSGNNWAVSGNSKLFYINAGTSNILFNQTAGSCYFYGGGHKYYNLGEAAGNTAVNLIVLKGYGTNPQNNVLNAGNYLIHNKDTFNIISSNNVTHAIIIGQAVPPSGAYVYNPDTLVIHKIIATGAINIWSNRNTIDSLIMGGAGNIYQNNIFNNLLSFTPGKTYNLGAGSVQWIKNKGTFYPIGTAANPINFYSTVTGQQAYVRKDSGLVCTDFINLKDIWAVGNGNNPAACNSFTNTNVNTNCPIVTTGTTTALSGYMVSTCDTIIDESSSCGPYVGGVPATFNYGRANFNGGPSANYQSNIYGWSKKPYPPTPILNMSTNSYTICAGDSIPLSFTGTGAVPFVVTYYDNHGHTLTDSVKTAAQLATYNAVTGAFTYSHYVIPNGNTNYVLGFLVVDRCFNSTSTTGTGTVSVLVNPRPVVTITNTNPSKICAGQTFTLTASSPGNTMGVYSVPSGGVALGAGVGSITYTVSPGVGTNLYYFDATTVASCATTKRVRDTLFVKPLPALPTVSGLQACSGSNYSIAATATATTFDWYSVASGGSSLYTGATYTATAASTQTLYVATTSTDNCVSSTRTPVTVTVTATPLTPTVSASSITQCAGNAINLNAGGSTGTYAWAGPNAYSATGASQALTASSTTSLSGTYSVQNTVTSGTLSCISGVNTISVTVNPVPAAATVSSNTVAVCAGQTVNMSVSPTVGGVNYTWNGPAAFTSTLATPSINNATASNAGIYNVTPSIGSCNGSITSVTVTINPLPTINITGNASICAGSSTTLTATSASASTFTWSSNAASATTVSVVITPTVTDTYTVTGTNTVTGCNATAVVTVTVIPTPTVSISSISNQTICVGNSTTLTPSGASSYSLTSAAGTVTTTTNFVLTPTVTTTYTLSGISGSCVSVNSATTTIVVNATPTVAIAGTNTICSGATTTLTASGANTYNWSNPVANNTSTVSVSPTTTTVYAVTGTNTTTGCVSASTNYTVTVNATPTVAVAGTNTICSGSTTTLTVSAATGGYVWSTTATTNTISVSPTTTTVYTVTGTNTAGSCTASASYTVTVNATPTVAVAGTNTICSGSSTNLTASGASTYNWINPVSTNTTVSVSPTTTTVYTVTGTTGTCTSTAAQYTVTVNATPTVAIAGTNTICSGSTTTLTASGATGGYTWSTAATTNTISVSPNSTTLYTVTGTSTYTNGLNCTSSVSQFTVNVNTTPTVSIAGTNTICSGSNTTLTASGASSYTWSTSVNTSTLNVSPVLTTTYNVTGTVGSCTSAITPYTVTVNATPTVSVAGTNTICSGNSTTLTASGAATSYTWTGNVNTNTLTINPTTTTVYTVAGTSNYAGVNCTSAVSQETVTVNATPTVAIAGTSTICAGNTTTLTASGSNNYTWASGPSTSTYVVTPSSTTVYTVTGTNTVGSCTSTSQFTVSVYSNPTLALNSSTNIKCLGDANGSATVTATAGSSPSYTVNWDNSVIGIIDNTLPAGTHTATITDANGCVNTTTLNIAAPTTSLSVSPVATTTTACGLSTGSATVTANGGWGAYTYSYTPSVGSTTNTATNLAGGGYAVQVTDANGCVVNTSFSISNPNSPTITVTPTTNTLCSGNSVVITPSGAATYTITGGSVLSPTIGTSFTVNPTSTTVYNLSGTDVSNCTGTGTTTITVNATPMVAVAGTNTICSGNATTLAASGANSYTWNTSVTPTSTINVNPTAQTIYTVIGTNTVGSCTASASYTVNVNSKPTLSLASSSNVKCLGDANGSATVTATNGATTYSYSIDALASTTSNVFTNLAAGTHTAYVNDANGCKDTLAINIVAPTASLTASVTTSTTGCGLANGSATVTASGGWNSYTYTPSNLQTSLAAGNYTTTVTDANGCVINTPFTIVNPATPTITAAASSNAICIGSTATITPSGASTYTITDGTNTYNTSTTQSVNPSAATVYTVTGTDVNNCVSNPVQLTISVNSLPTITLASKSDVKCLGDANGVATFTAIGGVGSYTYNLTSNTNTLTITPASFTSLAAGSYTATVADGNGCINTTPVTIAAPTASLSISSITTNTTSCGTATGSATVTASGGWNTSYTYTPSNPQNNLAAGDYTATVTDAKGCVATQTFAIVNPNAPTLTITPQNATICVGSSATITPSGATTYSLNGVATAVPFVVTPTATMVYSIEGSDASQCVSATVQYTVTVNSNPILNVTATSNIKCLGDANGSATVTTTAGSSTTYTYNLDGTPMSPPFTGLAAGTHTIIVNDGNGCKDTALAIIAAPTASLSIASIVTTTTGCGTATGSATVTATGGWASYTYIPSNPQNNLAAGNYTATVTDANGCVASQSFVISSPSSPTLAVAVSSGTLCAGGSTTLTASGSTTYSLNGVATASVMVVTPGVSTTYTVTGSNGGTCVSTPVQLAITVNNNPTLSVTATSNVKCLGDINGSATVTATNGLATYNYTIDTTPSASPVFTGLASGSHTVYVNDGNGCANTTTLNIAAPTASLSIASITTNTTACGLATGSATVTATGGWSSYTYTPSNPQSNLAAGNYTATVTDANGCIASQTFVINSPGAPTISVTVSSASLCAGSSSTITASGATSYSLNGTAAASPMIVTPNATTTYTVTGSNGGACVSAPLIASITVNTTPTVTVVSNNVSVCEGTTASLAVLNPTGTYTYTWSNASGTLNTGSSYDISNVQTAQAGIYTVTAVSTGNCINSAVADVAVNVCDVVVPQLVTPNGDGQNDAFEVKNISKFPNSKVQIYNRWGNIVYSVNEYKNDWKGTDDKGNGGVLPAGTYFVIVDYGDGKTPTYHGYIQLQY